MAMKPIKIECFGTEKTKAKAKAAGLNPDAVFTAQVPTWAGKFDKSLLDDFKTCYKFKSDEELYEKFLKHLKDTLRAKNKASGTKVTKDDQWQFYKTLSPEDFLRCQKLTQAELEAEILKWKNEDDDDEAQD
jgi:hypothetical protein